MIYRIRKYLIAGLLVWLPIIATCWLVTFLANLLDKSLKLLPKQYQPLELIGFNIPGLGVIFCFLILFITGIITTNFLGKYIISCWDKLIAKIPLISSVYKSLKQVLETILHSKGNSFRKVLLIEYPSVGLWSIAFQTNDKCDFISALHNERMVSVFIPTTPNPTSGFLIFLAKTKVRELDINIDDALKMVISLGVVQPKISSVKINQIKENDNEKFNK